MTIPDEQQRGTRLTAALANLIVVAPLLWAAVLQSVSATRYAAAVQEDGFLEWMSAWGFFVAALVFLLAARAEGRARIPWFSIGLALFCLLVALEEISWGQRVLGYRPPRYFLEHNYQQELNVHNLVDTSLRKLALKTVVIGYGVALPLLGRIAPTRNLLHRCGIWAPPLALAPGFALAAVAYQFYPLKFTGEVVELMLAMAFLCSALSSPTLRQPGEPAFTARLPPSRWLLIGVVAVALLGLLAAGLSARARSTHPGNVEAARSETEALKRDISSLSGANDAESASDCGLHRRVFTWVSREDLDAMYSGTFAGLQSQGLPEERADYFLDPWNSPYWIRHRCTSKRQRVTIYSFGPNRRRDSDSRQIRGDDIGAVIDLPARN